MRERLWPLLLFVALLGIAFYVSFQATLYYRLNRTSIAKEDSIAMQAGGLGILGRNVTLRDKLVNPDFKYSACVIDLRSGPYVVKGPAIDEYWSMAIIDRVGEAMFTASNDTSHKAGPYLVYATGYPAPESSSGYTLVKTTEPQGIVIFRILSNRENRPKLGDVEDELYCAPLRPIAF